jgi:hypothetical protein
MKQITRADIFQTLGRIAVQFATLEAELEGSLCVLANEENPMLVATLISRSSSVRKVDLLEHIAKFKGKVIQMRVRRLARILEPLRKRRNLFIHGRWDLSPRLLDEGKVAVTDSIVQYDESTRRGMHLRTWTKGRRQVFTYHQLRQFETEVMRALRMLMEAFPSAALSYGEAEARVENIPRR